MLPVYDHRIEFFRVLNIYNLFEMINSGILFFSPALRSFVLLAWSSFSLVFMMESILAGLSLSQDKEAKLVLDFRYLVTNSEFTSLCLVGRFLTV